MLLEQHPNLLALSASDMQHLADELREQARLKERERQKAWLNEAIQKGLDDIRAGRTVSTEEAMARHDAHRKEWLSQRATS